MSQVRRRQFLIVAGGLLAAPLVHAQDKSPHRVGFLALPNAFVETNPNHFAWRELEDALGKHGYYDGRTLVIERRHAGGVAAKLKEAAVGLVKSRVEVIAAFGGQNVKAAREATQSIPIVGYSGALVDGGFADSYARPGRNVTGVSPSTTDSSQKQLEFLLAAVPGVRRAAWLRNPTNPSIFSASFTRRIEESAAHLGVTATPFEVSTADALEAAIPEIARQGFGAVLVPADVFYFLMRNRLAQLLLAHRLPSATQDGAMLDEGLLLTYGVDYAYGIRRMASQIDRILKGANPATIPIEIIEAFSLGVNLRTARVLGLKIPQSLLLRADRVIE